MRISWKMRLIYTASMFYIYDPTQFKQSVQTLISVKLAKQRERKMKGYSLASICIICGIANRTLFL